MVRCNLSILLAERNLKITKVSNDTGISRTTLTYLANNYGKGIQYDTLNTLCTYLNVTPSDLISHIPIDVEIPYVNISGINYNELTIEVDISQKREKRVCSLWGKLDITLINNTFTAVEINIFLHDDEELVEHNLFVRNTLSSLALPFLKDIECDITSDIINDLSSHFHCEYDETPIDTSFYWNDVISRNN